MVLVSRSPDEVMKLWWVVLYTLEFSFDEFAALSEGSRRRLIEYVVRHEGPSLWEEAPGGF